MKTPRRIEAPNKKAPKHRGLESQTRLVPMRDAADYFFFFGAAFFLAFLAAFFIDWFSLTSNFAIRKIAM
jgi:hypothetical protein